MQPASDHRTHPEPDRGLAPAGCRWGRGAQSVVPYLAAAARSRPMAQPDDASQRDDPISNPVFRQMDIRLAWSDA